MNEIHLNSIHSTNTYAKIHASEFPPDQITCITADEQTAGKGRYKRAWVSPPGVNIYATFYFQLPPHTPHLTTLAQLIASSLATLLKNEHLSPKIKWPNDIQLNGKKVSGILCETTFHPHYIECFLGIGINVNMEESHLQKIDQPATSLRQETHDLWDRQLLLKKLQKQFSSDLQIFKKQGFTPFKDQIEEILAYKGEEIRCFDGKKEWVGICHSLTPDGKLNLLMPDKTIHTLLSGDISIKSTRHSS